ncbi:DsbA family oxidoreductase [Wohlfahrtiimonas larvae]|uniref:DsbA family oxidoreductase n=1 Tax=Wohlfahrtiimonas larvae TaxID=1157986 RepID=A0ABP9MNP1_9GAMM|nr:DsbA family oxidoreductase [Wohlfahrtiimonas larvae]
MKVEVWSDFSCPFCYIGVHNFYLAMDTFNDEFKRSEQLIFKSYELSPDAPFTNDRSYYEVLADKYDVPLDRAKAMTDNAKKIATEAGLTLNFDKAIAVSTSIAHRLITWVQNHHPDKTRDLAMRIFKAYFEDGLNIADDQVLSGFMTELNISNITLPEILTDMKISQSMTVDKVEAQSFEIRSVPFFVINRADAVAGAQTPMKFYELMIQIDRGITQ